jgi:hypothetical protein
MAMCCALTDGKYNVIWHQAPFSRVFMDSFEIMYPRRVQADFLTFNDAEPGARHQDEIVGVGVEHARRVGRL